MRQTLGTESALTPLPNR